MVRLLIHRPQPVFHRDSIRRVRPVLRRDSIPKVRPVLHKDSIPKVRPVLHRSSIRKVKPEVSRRVTLRNMPDRHILRVLHPAMRRQPLRQGNILPIRLPL